MTITGIDSGGQSAGGNVLPPNREADVDDLDAELIALRFALELSNEEIGRVVGRSTGATATALHRALRRLRRLLEEDSTHG